MSRTRSAKKKARRAPKPGNNFSRTVKALTWEQQSGQCALCSDVIANFHHRQLRAQGGPGDRANCLGVCPAHHHLIHHNVGWAYGHGLLVRSTMQPGDITWFGLCGVECETNHAGQ